MLLVKTRLQSFSQHARIVMTYFIFSYIIFLSLVKLKTCPTLILLPIILSYPLTYVTQQHVFHISKQSSLLEEKSHFEFHLNSSLIGEPSIAGSTVLPNVVDRFDQPEVVLIQLVFPAGYAEVVVGVVVIVDNSS